MGYFVGLGLGIAMGLFWAFTTVDAGTLDKLNTVCISNGGFDRAILEVGRNKVYCKDGAEFKLKD